MRCSSCFNCSRSCEYEGAAATASAVANNVLRSMNASRKQIENGFASLTSSNRDGRALRTERRRFRYARGAAWVKQWLVVGLKLQEKSLRRRRACRPPGEPAAERRGVRTVLM